MEKTAYYNELDDFAADWLELLIEQGLIPNGIVDRRSIEEVSPEDIVGFTQVHFFAGIGGWPLGLRLAGWPDDEEVGTGSCPCQPFANPGRKKGTADKRHLWPAMRRLVAVSDIPTWFGEQVESPLGRTWLTSVFADLEELGFDVAGAGLPAASVGAPQARGRIWWISDANDERRKRTKRPRKSRQAGQERTFARGEFMRPTGRSWPPGPSEIDRVPLLANGIPGVMGACKGYGNAIVPQVAAVVIRAFMELGRS